MREVERLQETREYVLEFRAQGKRQGEKLRGGGESKRKGECETKRERKGIARDRIHNIPERERESLQVDAKHW